VPIGTAFHERTFALCESLSYREWSGYYAVSAYETHHEHEYNAIRNAAALIDVSPLYKYRLSGKDAARLADRILTRDVGKLAVGQVAYTHWCDGSGKVIDDGTLARLEDDVFRWTAAEPNLRWIRLNSADLDVSVEEVSEETAALALQGPTSKEILKSCAAADVDGLRYFRVTRGEIAGIPVDISRTGYTGDLGYELWVDAQRALPLWDALMQAGRVPARDQVLVERRDVDQRSGVPDRRVLAVGLRVVGAGHLVAGPAAPGLGAHQRRGARMERGGLEHGRAV